MDAIITNFLKLPFMQDPANPSNSETKSASSGTSAQCWSRKSSRAKSAEASAEEHWKKEIAANCPQQNNGVDCGVFTLAQIAALSDVRMHSIDTTRFEALYKENKLTKTFIQLLPLWTNYQDNPERLKVSQEKMAKFRRLILNVLISE